VVEMERNANLPEIVFALAAQSGLARLLDRGQEQTHQDANDRDNDKELNHRERALPYVPGHNGITSTE